MEDRTSLLFALPGYRVLDVALGVDGGREVLAEVVDSEGGCPACGVVSSRVKDRPLSRVRDVPHGVVALRLRVRKRRFVCLEALCPRRSFTQASAQLPARSRVTTRLRERVGAAVAGANRAVSEVAAECGIAWATAHRMLVLAAAAAAGPAVPTAMIGIDETRARSVRWTREGDDGTGPWRRSDPWMTSIVDLDPGRPGGIIGLAAGRSGASVEAWMTLQGNDFREAVRIVAIDPSAPYASGIRRALPGARIVVDHFHLVMLANQMVTDVRQRVSRDRHGRRGRKADPSWANRQLLLRAGDRFGDKARARLDALFATDDPTGEIAAAWQCKELLRRLLAAHGPTLHSRHRTAHHLTRFLTACADAGLEETTRLATTVERWWPEIEGFLELGITNARTEGHNRVIKQIKRVGCGFRNQANYERRIMLHSATRRAA